jgi:hypothetical protein
LCVAKPENAAARGTAAEVIRAKKDSDKPSHEVGPRNVLELRPAGFRSFHDAEIVCVVRRSSPIFPAKNEILTVAMELQK